LKKTIKVGAYGWRHEHWLQAFYPEDLPVKKGDDWRLCYYSNEFDAVLVPEDYWQTMGETEAITECEDWLESVHPDFQFFVECHSGMFDRISLANLTATLKILAPQLSGLVIRDTDQLSSDEMKKPFIKLADLLDVEVICNTTRYSRQLTIWQAGESGRVQSSNKTISGFAFIDDELSDLRQTRVLIEQFASHIKADMSSADATIIVHHPRLQANQLNRLRSVLDIMGY